MKHWKNYRKIVAYLFTATLLFSFGYIMGVNSMLIGNTTMTLFNGHQFSPSEMRAVENVIASAGLRGHHWLGNQLLVPTNRQRAYVVALRDNTITTTNVVWRNISSSTGSKQNARIMAEKVFVAKERDCAAAIKMIRGVADATVHADTRPAWERNDWARTQITCVGVFVEAIDNKPLPAETIFAIGQIIKSTFGITDMKEISIVDVKQSRSYDGSGEELVESTTELRVSLHCPHPPHPINMALPEGEGITSGLTTAAPAQSYDCGSVSPVS